MTKQYRGLMQWLHVHINVCVFKTFLFLVRTLEKLQNNFDKNKSNPNQIIGIPSIQNEAKFLDCLFSERINPIAIKAVTRTKLSAYAAENSSLNPSKIRQIKSRDTPSAFTLLIPNCCGSVFRDATSNSKSLISNGMVSTITMIKRCIHVNKTSISNSISAAIIGTITVTPAQTSATTKIFIL